MNENNFCFLSDFMRPTEMVPWSQWSLGKKVISAPNGQRELRMQNKKKPMVPWSPLLPGTQINSKNHHKLMLL